MAIIVVILIFITLFFIQKWKKAENNLYEIQTRLEGNLRIAADEKDRLQDEFNKLQTQKKSSEVKLGGIAEQLAPFLKTFPCSVDDAHFMGQPIDYICFTEDGVHFVEIKSGDAQLSSKQRKIRDQIQGGKIFWHVMRVK